MNKYIEKIAGNQLFRNLNEEEFNLLLEPSRCILGHYKKKTIILQEGDVCNSICCLLEGSLLVQQLSPDGERIDIQIFQSGDCFGPALLYSSMPIYPYTLITLTTSSVLYIPFSQVEALLKMSTTFSKNYIIFLSNRIGIFQKKIRILSQKDVRSKLILYFSNTFQPLDTITFQLKHTKTEIADIIGVARPSVSRELKNMQTDGLIILERNMITIKKPEAFGYLFADQG